VIDKNTMNNEISGPKHVSRMGREMPFVTVIKSRQSWLKKFIAINT
jgi:hypothetical protein